MAAARLTSGVRESTATVAANPERVTLPNGATVQLVPADTLSAAARQRLMRLLNQAFRAHRPLFVGPRATAHGFKEQIAGHDLIVVTAAGEDGRMAPVAMALIYPNRGGLYFGMAAVAPAAQGQGYGRALLAVAEQEARWRRLPLVWLLAIVELGNAAYYERRGYRVTAQERMPAGTWLATAPFTLVTMEKRLAP